MVFRWQERLNTELNFSLDSLSSSKMLCIITLISKQNPIPLSFSPLDWKYPLTLKQTHLYLQIQTDHTLT